MELSAENRCICAVAFLGYGNDIEWGIYEFTRAGDKLKVKHIEGKHIFSGFEGDTLEFTYEREYYI